MPRLPWPRFGLTLQALPKPLRHRRPPPDLPAGGPLHYALHYNSWALNFRPFTPLRSGCFSAPATTATWTTFIFGPQLVRGRGGSLRCAVRDALGSITSHRLRNWGPDLGRIRRHILLYWSSDACQIPQGSRFLPPSPLAFRPSWALSLAWQSMSCTRIRARPAQLTIAPIQRLPPSCRGQRLVKGTPPRWATYGGLKKLGTVKLAHTWSGSSTTPEPSSWTSLPTVTQPR